MKRFYNMTVMPNLNCKYDAWNRLVEVNENIHYEYNGLNQRIKKTVGSTVTKSFFNKNWQELESVKEAGTSVPAETTSYIWGLRYIDDLILREKSEERLYSLADPNWNVVAVADSTGNVVERMKYDAFGKVNGLTSDWNRTFTGQVHDNETGLMLYRMRFYIPVLGRFIHRDHLGYNSQDYNLYRYVENSSIINVDIMGLTQYVIDKVIAINEPLLMHNTLVPQIDYILIPTPVTGMAGGVKKYWREWKWDGKSNPKGLACRCLFYVTQTCKIFKQDICGKITEKQEERTKKLGYADGTFKRIELLNSNGTVGMVSYECKCPEPSSIPDLCN